MRGGLYGVLNHYPEGETAADETPIFTIGGGSPVVGEKKAVATTKIKKDNPDKNVFIFGELIHNNQVIENLKNLGINIIYDIEDISSLLAS